MARIDRPTVVGLLVQEGAAGADADRVVQALERAGLRPARMRAWLASPQRAYPIFTKTVTVDGDPFAIHQTPIFAVEDGHIDRVIEEAERFAEASAEERFICLTLLCNLDAARRLTHGDGDRAQAVADVARLMHNKLRKDTRVHEALNTTLVPAGDDTRLVDCLLDDRLDSILGALRDGSLDPGALLAEGRLLSYGW